MGVNKFLFGKISRKLLIWFLVVSIIPLISISFVLLQSQTASITDVSLEGVEEEINFKTTFIGELLEDYGQDILILSKNQELEKLINFDDGEESLEDLKKDLEKDFLAFSEQRQEYYKIRYIDEMGQEIVGVGNDGENIYAISGDDLQNKSERYYFEDTMKLSLGEVFISPVDLNVEEGELENRGTRDNPIYVPVIRYATPLFDERGDRKGIIITNVYADFLFNFLKENRKGYLDVLVNSDGQYIHHPDSSRAFSFMFDDRDYNIEKDHGFEASEIFGSERGVMFHAEEHHYVVFKRINVGEDFWVLVNIIDSNVLLADVDRVRNIILIFGAVLVIAIVFFSLFFSRIITKPIEQLSVGALDFQKKNFKVKVNIKTGDELEDLGEAFNQTAVALDAMDREHKQLEKAKTDFLSITSHELRSPMTPMRAQLQMLLGEYYGKLSEKQKNSLEIVFRNTKRLDNIIVDFLEISRIEAARLKFRFKKQSPSDIIPNLVKEMSGFMPEKKIKIVTKVGKLPVIKHDPDRLSQILRNLINNAIKFSKSSSTVTVGATLKRNMIEFSIADNGIGIDSESQKRIFEPFFQAEQTIYREHQGTGLGLAIIKGIVESQEGQVWLKSEIGKGTTFFFTIPLKPVKEIKPIKLLFSAEKNREEKIKEIFIEILGPMGEREFDDIDRKNKLNEKDLIEYIGVLIKKGILDGDNGEVFKDRVLRLFGKRGGMKK